MHPHSGALRDGRDSLPVLGAFGEYLETERRRSRNRMLIMAGFFFLIVIMLVGAGILVGMLFFERVNADVHSVKSEMAGVRGQIQSGQERTRTSLAKLESETKNLLDGLAQHEEALSNTRSAVDSQRLDYEQELADMKQLMGLLKVENTALKRDIQLVTSRLPELAGNEGKPLVSSGGLAPSRPVAEPTLPASFELSLLPAGGSRTVPWRLPIPE